MRASLPIFILLGCIFTTYLSAKNHNTEIRAVWLATNWNLDWPSSPKISAEQQKKELTDILDKLQESNFNTVLFQVRIRSDVFYRSQIEPFSPFFQKNTAVGARIEYDPLAFVIEECHKRGLECHAWFVTYPVGTKKQVTAQGNQSVTKKYPQICKLHDGEWYLDPGEPQTRKYILSLVDEIVENYDIDGIHFDYIRYPENAKKFPDNTTFRKYGKGKPLNEWRRDNITHLVSEIHQHVKAKKPWVQISSSPLGRYKNLNPLRGTWTAYESVHQDAGLWLNSGLMDAVYPMLYYNEDNFQSYVNEWQKTSGGRFVVPGLGVYRLNKTEGDWSPSDLTKQIDNTRVNDASGQAYYRAGNVLSNTKGIKHQLDQYYKYPAKIPAMQWINKEKPQSPQNLQVYRDEDGTVVIEWEEEERNKGQQLTYTLYESSVKDIDIEDPTNMIITRFRGNKIHLNTDDSERGVYYTITASDRYHNESQPDYPVYFILSTGLEK